MTYIFQACSRYSPALIEEDDNNAFDGTPRTVRRFAVAFQENSLRKPQLFPRRQTGYRPLGSSPEIERLLAL